MYTGHMLNLTRHAGLIRGSDYAYALFNVLVTVAREDGVFRVDIAMTERMARRRAAHDPTTMDEAIRELKSLMSAVYVGNTLYGEIYGLDKYVDEPHETI